eukprot:14920743-Ditylum_brightwellii.AAC.1
MSHGTSGSIGTVPSKGRIHQQCVLQVELQKWLAHYYQIETQGIPWRALLGANVDPTIDPDLALIQTITASGVLHRSKQLSDDKYKVHTAGRG